MSVPPLPMTTSMRHIRRFGQPWTAEEDAAVLGAERDFRAVAARLERTTASVASRRSKLLRRAHLREAGC